MGEPWSKRVVIGDATLYLGDCIEVLRGLRDGCQNGDVSVEQGGGAAIALPTRFLFDAVITDPPYGVNLGNHRGANDFRSGVLHKGGYESYDDTPENFAAVVAPAIRKALSLSRRGAVFMSGTSMWMLPAADAIGGIYLPSGMGRNSWGFSSIQHCLFYGSAPDLNRGAKATAIYSTEVSEKNGHPCPKPVGWMTWVIGLASRQADTILDPFMGSGTTGVACMNLGRRFVGIEICEKYFDIACSRIENAQRQSKLFDEPKRKVEQGGLFNDAA